MRYFAELDGDNVVLRVIVASDLAWCQGTFPEALWVETIQDHSVERYAGRGMVYVEGDPRRFLYPSEV
jgi:hypothetical protein